MNSCVLCNDECYIKNLWNENGDREQQQQNATLTFFKRNVKVEEYANNLIGFANGCRRVCKGNVMMKGATLTI